MRKILVPRLVSSLVVALIATAAATPAAVGQELAELAELGESFKEEMQQLGVDTEEYAKARQRERRTLDELLALQRDLDARLVDPGTSLANLRRMERQIESLRQEAFDLSTTTAEERLGMYARMERVESLLAQIEQQGVDIVPTGTGVAGTWQISVPQYEVTGVLSLRQDGALVTGSLLVSTGARASVTGTFAGGRLELDQVESDSGRKSHSTADLDPESGQLRGSWQALALTTGEPSAANWSARRVSSSAELLEPH